MNCKFIKVLRHKIQSIFYFLYLKEYNSMQAGLILIVEMYLLKWFLLDILHTNMINSVVYC
jgi:hypothetical protein